MSLLKKEDMIEMENPGQMTGVLIIFDDEPTLIADNDPHVSWSLSFDPGVNLTDILALAETKVTITTRGIYRVGMVAPNLGLADVAAIYAA